jgi:hypothetical protein
VKVRIKHGRRLFRHSSVSRTTITNEKPRTGYSALQEITDHVLAQIPSGTRGQDGLAVALSLAGRNPAQPAATTHDRGTGRDVGRARALSSNHVALVDLTLKRF